MGETSYKRRGENLLLFYFLYSGGPVWSGWRKATDNLLPLDLSCCHASASYWKKNKGRRKYENMKVSHSKNTLKLILTSFASKATAVTEAHGDNLFVGGRPK